jgi:hypothetical protein
MLQAIYIPHALFIDRMSVVKYTATKEQVLRRINLTSIHYKLQYHMKVNCQLHVAVNLTPVKDLSLYIRVATGRDPEPIWTSRWKEKSLCPPEIESRWSYYSINYADLF